METRILQIENEIEGKKGLLEEAMNIYDNLSQELEEDHCDIKSEQLIQWDITISLYQEQIKSLRLEQRLLEIQLNTKDKQND